MLPHVEIALTNQKLHTSKQWTGENIVWLSAQIGHSNVLITAKTYAR